ncbi:MAG: hypothetical protein IJV65_04455 [Kiritimatiellae bacterium]|nr:hypothetical protein [Kiritimatiellia bacterium]
MPGRERRLAEPARGCQHEIAFRSRALALPAAAALPEPSDATFAKGAKFTVSGYEVGKPALSGFPVLVRIAAGSPSGFSYADMQSANAADKDDIDLAFVDMDGSGLPFEIDTWDPQGTSLVWVRLPVMTNGAEFVMCWGSSSSGKAVSSANPWTGYAGVWHLNEEGLGGTSANSTAYGSVLDGANTPETTNDVQA